MKNAAPPQNVDDYLALTPEPARSTLEKVRAVIRASVPREATETISYRIPMFKYKGMLMGFAAFKHHCSLFPANMDVFRKLKKELEPFHTSKGTLQFPLDKPFPAAFLKKIVKMRVAQNDAKEKIKKQKNKTL
jgi:uncharacterized protein YdhG (YjbR/CyaY superfamily)